MICTTPFTCFTGLGLAVLRAQVANLLNRTVRLDHALESRPMLLEADQILRQIRTIPVQHIATRRAATSLLYLVQNLMLLEALDAH